MDDIRHFDFVARMRGLNFELNRTMGLLGSNDDDMSSASEILTLVCIGDHIDDGEPFSKMMSTSEEYTASVPLSPLPTTGEEDTAMALPLLERKEFRKGQSLGIGAFCRVFAVKTIFLKKSGNGNLSERLETDQKQIIARHNLVSKFLKIELKSSLPDPAYLEIWGKDPNQERAERLQGPPPRLVVKEIKENLNEYSMKRATKDLKIELDILTSISEDAHPNIIELHAIGVDPFELPENNDYPLQVPTAITSPKFLVLSRIRATLKQVIRTWQDRKGSGLFLFLGLNSRDFQQLWLERMLVLVKITDAIRFLHSKKIMFRDLKPDNIGFDDDDVPKIFDFGLAKQINSETILSNGEDETYELTGNTGTIRYMPPEVAKREPYGFSVDLYSLAILIHEVLTLKLPFANIPPSDFRRLIFQNGIRPPLDQGWPTKLKALLRAMWAQNPRERPTADDVASSLEEMLRGSNEELFPNYIL